MVTSSQIVALLAERHSEDIFVPECRDGPSWSRQHYSALDAWSCKRSYQRLDSVGYEIKVSRQDWLRDEKWQPYLKVCNRLYFVSPPDVIQLDELPQECGLLHVSSGCKRLLTRRKAVYRDIQLPNEFLLYLVFCRMAVDKHGGRQNDNVRRWLMWMAERDEKKHLGHAASRKIRKVVQERIERAEAENKKLKLENDSLIEVKKFVSELGVDLSWSPYNRNKENIRARFEKLNSAVPQDLKRSIIGLRHALDGTIEELNKLDKKGIMCHECEDDDDG